MKINWISIVIATVAAFLLAWWLWHMGIEDSQKWLMACVGGGVMEIGLIGGMAISYPRERSGYQVKLIYNLLASLTFIYSCVLSFFRFSPVAYVIPVGLLLLICISVGMKIYKTGE